MDLFPLDCAADELGHSKPTYLAKTHRKVAVLARYDFFYVASRVFQATDFGPSDWTANLRIATLLVSESVPVS
jgi:hypothetical protein